MKSTHLCTCIHLHEIFIALISAMCSTVLFTAVLSICPPELNSQTVTNSRNRVLRSEIVAPPIVYH